MTIGGDNPIENVADDVLMRRTSAKRFAEQLGRLDVTHGSVVAVLGPWGSGKTSFINLVRDELPKDQWSAILEFNPWMFSGSDQLVQTFFTELAAQLNTKDANLKKVGGLFETYGDLLTPAGELPWVGAFIKTGAAVTRAAKSVYDKRRGGVLNERKVIETELRKLKKPVLVVIDDIDRLNIDEIRNIFRLVRLTGSFPNIVYLLAFDRARVEQALDEDRVKGRDYLEKIVQIGIDLPAIPKQQLITIMTKALDETLRDITNPGPFNEDGRWSDVLAEIIAPLVRHMRDVRRYVSAVDGAVRSLDGQVALEDVLALEALRVFRPDIFGQLPHLRSPLTEISSGYRERERDDHKAAIEQLLTSAGTDAPIVRALIERVFEAAKRYTSNTSYGIDFQRTWMRKRRVAHPDILDLYLEQVANEAVQAFDFAEGLIEVLHDEGRAKKYYNDLPLDNREEIIRALEYYEGEYPVAGVPVGVTLLMNDIGNLPERPRGMFDYDAHLAVNRVVLRMLRQLPNEAAIEKTVEAVLPLLGSLSSQADLITLVGYRDGAGHKLISEAKFELLQDQMYARVRAATPKALANEWDLLRLLLDTKRSTDPAGPAFTVPVHAILSPALLRSAKSEVRSQGFGTRAMRRSARLHWKVLEEIWGTDQVAAHLKVVQKLKDEDIAALVELANKYMGGWDPDKLNGDDFTDE